MVTSINVVLPLFVMAFVGYFVGKLGWLDEKTMGQLNKIIFDILFPCSFFISTYNSAGKINIGPIFIIIIIAVEVVSFLLTYIIAKSCSKRVKQQGALHQTMFRSNMILFGTAIVNSLLTTDEIGVYTIALLVILPLQNIGSIIGKELFGTGEDNKTNPVAVIKGILTSTHVVSILLGLIVGNIGIVLPEFIVKACTDFGAAGSPVQLLVLGASLKFSNSKKHLKELIVGVIVKLFLVSALIVPVISLFSLTFAESFVLMLLCSAPTAVTTFTISMKQNWDIDLVNEMILFTTIISLFSLTFWMYVLQIIV